MKRNTGLKAIWLEVCVGAAVLVNLRDAVPGGWVVKLLLIALLVLGGVLYTLGSALVALGERIGGRITAVTAGALAATAGASPFVESFTLCGELVAAVLAAAAVLLYLRSETSRGPAWLAG